MKIAIYCHDTFGLGHISRAMKVAKIMRRAHHATTYIITGSGGTAIFSPPSGVDFVKLPTITRVYGNDKPYQSAAANIDSDTVIAIRKSILQAFFIKYNPDIVIVDHSPTGIMGELIPSLDWLKKKKKKLIFITRDIIDTPTIVKEKWNRNENYRILKKYYDKFLIAGDRKYYDSSNKYGFNQIGIPCDYVGYMFTPRPKKKQTYAVTISFGGGRDGSQIVQQIVDQVKKSTLMDTYTFNVVLGPLFDPKIAHTLKKARMKGIRFLDSTPYAEPLNSGLRITMGGYNTFCESISSLTPTIIIPREDVEKEQLIRATLFQKIGIVALVRQKEINQKLLPTIQKLLKPRNNKTMIEKQKKMISTNHNRIKEAILS